MLLFCDIFLKISKQHNNETYFLYSLIPTSVLKVYLEIPTYFNSRTKFDYYETILNSKISDDSKKIFDKNFNLSQKNYWILHRFFKRNLIKRKKYKYS